MQINNKLFVVFIAVISLFLLSSCVTDKPLVGQAGEMGVDCPEIDSCQELARFSDINEDECVYVVNQRGCEVEYAVITDDCECGDESFSCDYASSCSGELDPEEIGCELNDNDCDDLETVLDECFNTLDEYETDLATAEESYLYCEDSSEEFEIETKNCYELTEELEGEQQECNEKAEEFQESSEECQTDEDEYCSDLESLLTSINELRDTYDETHTVSFEVVGESIEVVYTCESIDTAISIGEEILSAIENDCEYRPASGEVAMELLEECEVDKPQVEETISNLEAEKVECEEIGQNIAELESTLDEPEDLCFRAAECKLENDREYTSKIEECDELNTDLSNQFDECEDLSGSFEEKENECKEKLETYLEIKENLEETKDICEELEREFTYCSGEESCEDLGDVELEYDCSCDLSSENCEIAISDCLAQGDILTDCDLDISACADVNLGSCSCDYECDPDVPGCGRSLFDDFGSCEETVSIDKFDCEDTSILCQCEIETETTVVEFRESETNDDADSIFSYIEETRSVAPPNCEITNIPYLTKIKKGSYEAGDRSIRCSNDNGCVICNERAGCEAGYIIRDSQPTVGQFYNFINENLSRGVMIYNINSDAETFSLSILGNSANFHLFTPAETNYYPCGEVCNDGIDNDDNGGADCVDRKCQGKIGMTEEDEWGYADQWGECENPEGCLCEFDVELTCDDGFANDHDHKGDCANIDCESVEVSRGQVCEGRTESTCNDRFDNDGDGLVDCADPDCEGDEGGREPELQLCELETESTCNDGFDNDADRKTDCADSDCSSKDYCEVKENRCNDNFDNDGDRLRDCADPDCEGDEGGPELQLCELQELNDLCFDGFDNDADRKTDCADSGCITTCAIRNALVTEDERTATESGVGGAGIGGAGGMFTVTCADIQKLVLTVPAPSDYPLNAWTNVLRYARINVCQSAGCAVVNEVDQEDDTCQGIPTSCPDINLYNYWSSTVNRDFCNSVTGCGLKISGTNVICAPDCTDSDSDGYCKEASGEKPAWMTVTGWGDLNDNNPSITDVPPPELCDGVDNDGDGLVDEGCGDMIAYFSFDDSLSLQVEDDSNYTHSGRLQGASWAYDGVSGRAVSFDGTDDYVEPTVTGTGLLDAHSAHTVEAWIKRISSTGRDSIFREGGGSLGYELMVNNGRGTLMYIIRTAAGNTNRQFIECSLDQVPENTWVHVAATYEGGSAIRLYINGQECKAKTESVFTSIGNPANDWSIGGHPTEKNVWANQLENWFLGMIDEVKVYKVALSAGEIQSHYQELVSAEICSNFIDDDFDGEIDCADSDCTDEVSCAGRSCSSSADCTLGDCVSGLTGQVYNGLCLVNVGICHSVTLPADTPETNCNDGKDNNCDGLVDCADDGCALNDACTGEIMIEEIITEDTAELCADGRDNDGDSLVDCADDDCAGSSSCQEQQTLEILGKPCKNNNQCTASEFCYQKVCTPVPSEMKGLIKIVEKMPKKGTERLQRLNLITKFLKEKIKNKDKPQRSIDSARLRDRKFTR